ncbi:IMP dehydrogenase [Ignisphaera aggregans DSM 17230]|uniref:IMP dehydrogenase n=1 Tax=Ignisphaera aggregans (strain DSM 17230 / JCM 13409 / AQ1.S1) TaxID=583356 RepID=E0STV6_IGNAA|nr:IMP dehydrogenase [Ignisphaera aggregans DSM 17230]
MGFREKLSNAIRAIDFGDIYLRPSLSPVDPNEVDTSTRFTRNIRIKIPIVSSPMDTVTELDMAIAMALLGGIGVVHRNMSIDQQLDIVRKVKEHPPIRLRRIYVSIGDSCRYALEIMKSYGIRSIPVVDSDTKVVGYVYIHDVLDRESMYKPVAMCMRSGEIYSVRDIERARDSVIRGSMDTVAIVSHNGDYLGTLTLDDALLDVTPSLDENGSLLVAAAISPYDFARAEKLDRYVDAFVSDVAHFHNINVIRASKELVKKISADFVAGNIATYDATIDVLTHIDRVDAFRVGLGGGSICTTPQVAGAYIPTLWGVAEVRDALEDQKVDIPIIADGGIRTGGDIVKALATGASSAMVGYLVAGTDEASAPIIAIGDNLYKPYRGMASIGAMKRRFAVDRYSRVSKRVAEGVEGLVPYRGSVYNVIQDVVEAIRAGMGYAGARTVEELWSKAIFISTRSKDKPVDLHI